MRPSNDIEALNKELTSAIMNQSALHDKMRLSNQFYKESAFFAREPGQAANKNEFQENLLAVFADKNIEYTSTLPTVKVPTPAADENMRQAASKREKLIHAVRRTSNMAQLQRLWARDATLSGIAIAETYPNLKTRCMEVKRYSPLKCYWQISNNGENKVLVFWAVFAMTADEAYRQYGVRPTRDLITPGARADFKLPSLDGKTWFTHAIRWDDTTRTKWVGDAMIEEPHQHAAGEMPIDICVPILPEDDNSADPTTPGFYLDPLIPLQAELNDVYYRRGRIVRRMSSPVVWVRGVANGKLDDVKSEMSKPGGGVVALKADGEAGLLQLGETAMLNDHEDRTILAMTRLAGYGNAAFGESVGANTSGDALGMYFNATQRKIETQWISWIAFHESINAKILRGYFNMLLPDEPVNVAGYAPSNTLQTITNDDGTQSYMRTPGAFNETVQRADIAGAFLTVCIPPTAAPRNKIEEQRIAIEAVDKRIIARATAAEKFDVLSPPDEFLLIEQENQSPAVNPDGIQKLLSGYAQFSNIGNTTPAAPPVEQ